MLDTLIRLYNGYARPQQIIVLCCVYYAVMFGLNYLAQGDQFSDLTIFIMALDWSVGVTLAYAGWNTFKRYKEDPLRAIALIIAVFGSAVLLLAKY
ncbi:MAG: hypothetical protein OXR68_03880 [Alphaproteobacteria bacterium]|nr:hypothetical protein [Alphaproteobacteria bacterium]MDD9919745.1 hypothetical protein [Alphaproteobacteria bacterium]